MAARRLTEMGVAVRAFVVAGSGDPAGKRSAAEDVGVPIEPAKDEAGIDALRSADGMGRRGHRRRAGAPGRAARSTTPSAVPLPPSGMREHTWSPWTCRPA